MDFTNLQKLTQLDGISGRESAVREEIVRQLVPLAKEVHTDAMGNVLAFVPGKSEKTLILSAHMDEVGLMVSYISAEGFLFFTTVGGIDYRTLLAQRVRVHTARGMLTGVIGTKPAHITSAADRSKSVPLEELYIDVGLGSAAAQYVQVGDFATLQRPYEELGDDFVSTKALDDRVGCFCILEALKKVSHPAFNVQVVFSTQEEVGLRGAMAAATGLKADVALAVDATGAADVPFCHPKDYIMRLGGGAGISALDAATITQEWLFENLKAVCEQQQIAYQVRIAPRGGNDAGAFSRMGMPACALSVPVRNIHSNVEVANKGDIVAMIDLLSAILAGKLQLPKEDL